MRMQNRKSQIINFKNKTLFGLFFSCVLVAATFSNSDMIKAEEVDYSDLIDIPILEIKGLNMFTIEERDSFLIPFELLREEAEEDPFQANDEVHNDLPDNIVITKGDEPVFMYRDNTLKGDVSGILDSGCAGKIVSEGDDIYLISSGGYTGFIAKDNLITGNAAKTYAENNFDKYGNIVADTTYIYENKTLDGAVLNIGTVGYSVKINDETDTSYEVELGEGRAGYVRKENISKMLHYKEAEEPDLIKLGDENPEEAFATYESEEEYDLEQGIIIPEEEIDNDSNITPQQYDALGKDIVEYALQFVGNPYVWGGTSLTNGCDCSGFIMKIYEHFGITLPHSSFMMRSYGQEVCSNVWDESLAMPGDIICYEGHVALYIGNGNIVHAKCKKEGIVTGKADYRKGFVTCRRLVAAHGIWGNVSDEDYEALCKIVSAEAGGEDLQTQIYIADVILNRVVSRKFHYDTIKGVIMAPGQFSPVANGRFDKAVPSETTIKAVNHALTHLDETGGALYFMNPNLSSKKNVEWFNNSLTYLFTRGVTQFFK